MDGKPEPDADTPGSPFPAAAAPAGSPEGAAHPDDEGAAHPSDAEAPPGGAGRGGARVAIAVEAVIAAVLIALSVWFWNLGVTPARTPVQVPGHGPVEVTVYNGARITTAAVMMAAAGLAAVDAVRRWVSSRAGPPSGRLIP